MSVSKPPLAIVSDSTPEVQSQKTIGERVAALQVQARSLAVEHVQALVQAINVVEELSAEIAKGGEAYHVGIRELAGRMAADAEANANTIEAILTRR